MRRDDDSGPNFYSLVTTNSTESGNSRAVFGLYPGSSGAGALLKDDCSTSCPDADGDGVSDALETAAGTSPSSTDSDQDGIIDRLELFGDDGYSFSEGDATIRCRG